MTSWTGIAAAFFMAIALTLSALLSEARAEGSPAAATGGSATQVSGNPTGKPAPGTWRFELSPYLWGTRLQGKVRPVAGAPTFDASLSLRDVLNDLDAALFLSGTARRDRFVLLADFIGASLSEKSTISGVLPVPVSISGKVSLAALTLVGGYSVLEQPGLSMDLGVGARAMRVTSSVDAAAVIAPFYTVGASASQTDSWVDPIVAAAIRGDIAPNWTLAGYGDIGGFGVGSRLTWQLVGTLHYRLSDHFSVSAGYRYMAVDYRSKGTLLDLDMSGPLVGATVHF